MARTYYTLFCREGNGWWFPQFGDYSRAVVKQEEIDCYRDWYKAKDCQIIRHDDTVASLELVKAKANEIK